MEYPESRLQVSATQRKRRRESRTIGRWWIWSTPRCIHANRTHYLYGGHTEIKSQIAQKELTVEVLALTSKLLAKNPEYYTIWNHRRLIMLHLFDGPLTEDGLQQLDQQNLVPREKHVATLLTDDLRMLIQLLLQFPKCYWIWNYRQWLLEQAERNLHGSMAIQLWQQELALVGKMLARDERNFHGWSYRRTVVASLERLTQKSMVEEEYDYTTRMIRSGLKNFSAWHNRSKLIPRLLDERQADEVERRKMLGDELDLIQIALTDPFNQSAWDYHAFLMGTLTSGSLVDGQIVKSFTNLERVEYFEREMARAKEMLEIDDDCKLVYEALLSYAVTYLMIEGGNKYVTTQELREWLSQLRKLDKLRAGRWENLETTMNL